MKKISQLQWERYKNYDGKEVIAEFEKLCADGPFDIDLAIDMAKRFDREWFSNAEKSMTENLYNILPDIFEDVKATAEMEGIETFSDFYFALMENITNAFSSADEIKGLDDFNEGDFKPFLNLSLPISLILFWRFPEVYLPNFFAMQFFYLKKIAKEYEIELPESPKKSKYFDRCAYYFQMCVALHAFRIENNLSPAELCAFLFHYQIEEIRQQISLSAKEEMPQPSQAWYLVGNYYEEEAEMNCGYWQASPETRRGDILFFYEKLPVKAINAYWRATEDGFIDPFGSRYSYAYIADKKELPKITLEELRNDEYFSQQPIIRKNFQDCSGWRMSSEDFKNIKRMLAAKGFDINTLPTLMAHEVPDGLDLTQGGTLKPEQGVHQLLVLPLLEKMGWTVEGGDILTEVIYHMGRGKSRTNGRSDLNLHPRRGDKTKARVVIEEKAHMDNEAEIHDTFVQGVSYAMPATADVMAICDDRQIRVYCKSGKEFNEKKPIIFYWDEMGNPDKFNELKNLLS